MRQSNRNRAVLLLSCRDQRGLVAAVSQFVYKQGGNIVHADQHTDMEQGLFLQRVEWDLDRSLSRQTVARAFEPLARRFHMDWKMYFTGQPIRAAILVSKELHCMYDLLARWGMDELPMDIPVVLSNHKDAQSAARHFGLPFVYAPVGEKSPGDQETVVMRELARRKIDLVILARYMRILGPRFVNQYRHSAINIHHSFLPAFVGAKPYHQAHERGVKIIGATAHYVTQDLDEGPIIEQDVVRVSHRDAVPDLVRKGRDLEKVVLARAVKLHVQRRIVVYGNKTVVFD